jgi:hypothetical protein
VWWSELAVGLGDQRLGDDGESVEGVGEVAGPGPADVDSDLGLVLAADEAGGDVEQPEAQCLGSALARSPVSRVVWVQAMRSAAVRASCSQAWLIWNSGDGNRRCRFA